MSAPWLLQGGIACAGIAVAAAVAWTARRWSRRDPVLGYSFVVALLVAALLAPAAQWWVRGTRHAAAEPWRQWWRATFATGESGAIPAGNDGDGELRSVAPRTPSAADGAADGASPKSPGVLVFRDRRDSSPAGGRLGSGRPRGATGIVEAPAPTAPRFDPGADFDVGGQPADLRRTGVLAAGGSKAVSGWPAFDRATGQRALLTIWFAGVVVLLVRRGRRLAGTLRLIRRAGPVVQADHLELWADLQRETPVAARARLRRSDSVTSPACFGWLRPVLLIPDRGTSALSTDALRWALRHELVHVARGDALVAAAQAVATTLFWFHPAAWWLSAEATRLRELSCDLEVVRRCGRRRNYAHALLEHVAVMDSVSSASDAGPHSAGVRCALLHWGRSPTQIERRIEMLTSGSLVEAPSARRCGGRLLAGSLFLLPLLTQLGAAATLVPGDEPVAPRASASTVPSAVPGISPAPAAPARPDVAAASAAPAGPAETTAPSHVSLLTGTALGHVSQSTGGVAGDDRAKTKRVRVNKVAPAGAVPAAPTDDAVAPQPRTAETVRRLHELATALSDG
jgi:beta-lactamase regulating signal transducer with metallopeptidase domain